MSRTRYSRDKESFPYLPEGLKGMKWMAKHWTIPPGKGQKDGMVIKLTFEAVYAFVSDLRGHSLTRHLFVEELLRDKVSITSPDGKQTGKTKHARGGLRSFRRPAYREWHEAQSGISGTYKSTHSLEEIRACLYGQDDKTKKVFKVQEELWRAEQQTNMALNVRLQESGCQFELQLNWSFLQLCMRYCDTGFVACAPDGKHRWSVWSR